jgi:hypothetical protein
MSIDPPASEADQAAAMNSPSAASDTFAFARAGTPSVEIDSLETGPHPAQASSRTAPALPALPALRIPIAPLPVSGGSPASVGWPNAARGTDPVPNTLFTASTFVWFRALNARHDFHAIAAEDERATDA